MPIHEACYTLLNKMRARRTNFQRLQCSEYSFSQSSARCLRKEIVLRGATLIRIHSSAPLLADPGRGRRAVAQHVSKLRARCERTDVQFAPSTKNPVVATLLRRERSGSDVEIVCSVGRALRLGTPRPSANRLTILPADRAVDCSYIVAKKAEGGIKGGIKGQNDLFESF
jgi:hypothetical protein